MNKISRQIRDNVVMQRPARSPTLLIFVLLVACSDSGEHVSLEPQALAVPANVPSYGPRISGNDSTALMLSWMEPGDDHTTLKYSSYQLGRWSAPTRVADVEDMFVNWADMPSVLPLAGGRLVAHWLQKSADQTYAYDVMFTQSADNGSSWSEPIRPHSDGTPTEHGFVSMFRSGDHTGLIWLDGRKMVNETTDDPVSNGMTLRGAFINDEQTLQGEQLIDELICDCCQTDVAIAASGPVAVYRDRTANEIRDIYVTRLIDGQWSDGQRIATDNWQIPGCPVNGPSMVADDDAVAVAWFTAADETPIVKVSWSGDSGASFTAPVEIASAGALGRVGLALLDSNTAAVSWLEGGDGEGRTVRVRSVTANGVLGTVRTVTRMASTLAVPQLAKHGDELVFVWTESDGADTRIVSSRVPIAAL